MPRGIIIGEQKITLPELAQIQTPAPTNTWRPLPHIQIPMTIENVINQKGWEFRHKDHFSLFTSRENQRLVGITEIIIPEIDPDPDFGIAIGFMNSHDKSVSVRLALGTNVFTCQNMTITADVQVKRKHSHGLSIEEEIEEALNQIPDLGFEYTKWFGGLRDKNISQERGVDFLARCAADGALPVRDFLGARGDFLEAYNGMYVDSPTATDGANLLIDHGNTLWGAYNAVTAQLKKRNLGQLQGYTEKLNLITDEYLNLGRN